MVNELTTALISIAAAGITTSIAYFIQKAKLQDDFKRDVGKVRTQYQAEEVAKMFLDDSRWKQRSFKQIKHHLGGFDDDELRQILVRAGAVRFGIEGDNELWGLITRNLDKLQEDSDKAKSKNVSHFRGPI